MNEQVIEMQDQNTLQGNFWKNLKNAVVNVVTAKNSSSNNTQNSEPTVPDVVVEKEEGMSTPVKVALIGGGALILALLIMKK